LNRFYIHHTSVNRQVVEVGCGSGLALEHGIKALDRADDHAGRFVEHVAGEMLDDVFLGELAVVHGRDELLEFLERLLAEIAAIHQEQDTLRPGVFDEAIDKIDGGEGFARTGNRPRASRQLPRKDALMAGMTALLAMVYKLIDPPSRL
jgi:hypothetical protein